jgi:hypothetical protein
MSEARDRLVGRRRTTSSTTDDTIDWEQSKAAWVLIDPSPEWIQIEPETLRVAHGLFTCMEPTGRRIVGQFDRLAAVRQVNPNPSTTMG